MAAKQTTKQIPITPEEEIKQLKEQIKLLQEKNESKQRITISLYPATIKLLDKDRKGVSRSAYIERLINPQITKK